MVNKPITILITSLLLIAGFASLNAKGEPALQPLNSPDNEIIDMIEQVNQSLVYYYHNKLMSFGPRYTGSKNCTLAAQYIYDEFEAMGLPVEFHNWSYANFTAQNVVATLRGKDTSSNATYIMSAHYDTVRVSPGADDDGSGVAAVLATAKILSKYSFNYTIRFITFSGEEVGTYGSFTYARDAYRKGDNIVAVINPDMVGYANSDEGGQILRFFYPERSKWIADFATTVNELYINQTNLTIESLPDYIGSDHQAFVDYGYDAVWIAHHDGYQWGHSINDTADHINWTYTVKATKLLLAVVAELASTPLELQVIIKKPYEGFFYFFNYPIIHLDLGKYWTIGFRGTTVILGRANASAEVITNEDIKYVIFCIDGNFIYWSTAPPYTWKIQGMYPLTFGKHTLKIYAYTKSGKIATDQMDIIIFTRSYAFE